MWLIYIIEIYLMLGLVFSVPFVLTWINKIDGTAQSANWAFRLMIFPGCVLLWPMLLRRILSSK